MEMSEEREGLLKVRLGSGIPRVRNLGDDRLGILPKRQGRRCMGDRKSVV